MKQKIRSLMHVFEYVVAFIVLAVAVMYMFYRPAPVTEYISYGNTDRNEKIKSIIVWETDYSKKLEKLIIYNLNLLPDSIIDGWLSIDCSIVVCPNIKGYLDDDTVLNISDNLHTTAYNVVSTEGDEVISSDIYILGSSKIINSSLLHEMGHYVYYEYFGAATDYILPSYEAECAEFIENECAGLSYYMVPNEYFAEIFSYTVLNGTNENYSDTYVMKKIIDDF